MAALAIAYGVFDLMAGHAGIAAVIARFT